MKSEPPDPRYVAIHEAGHAVIGQHHNLTLRAISIEPGPDGSGGRVEWKELPGMPRILSGEEILDRIRMMAGGQAAQENRISLDLNVAMAGEPDDLARHWAVRRRNIPDVNGDRDRDQAVNLATHMPGVDPVDLVNELWEETRAAIKQPAIWAAVEALADALQQERTMSGERARAIIAALLPPRALPDPRPRHA